MSCAALGAESIGVEVNVASETVGAATGQRDLRAFRARRYSSQRRRRLFSKSPVVSKPRKSGTARSTLTSAAIFCARGRLSRPCAGRRAAASSASPLPSLTPAPVRRLRRFQGRHHRFRQSACPGGRPRRHHRQRDLSRLGQHLHAAPTPLRRRSDGAPDAHAAAAYPRTRRHRRLHLFLASDAAKFITGQSYNINSGTYMF